MQLKVLSLLDKITASIPRADWREIGITLARGESLQAEVDTLIGRLTAAEQEALGLALIRKFREPLPRQKRQWSPNHRQSKHPRERIVELRRQGIQFTDIADLLGIPASSCKAVIQSDARELLTRHPVRTTPEQRNQVIELRKAGLAYSEIAERVGINVATARSIGKRDQ